LHEDKTQFSWSYAWPANDEGTSYPRYLAPRDVPECDVIVTVLDQEMSLSCPDYNQAAEWARIEYRSYKIAGGFVVER
jgi:hypothetical protein